MQTPIPKVAKPSRIAAALKNQDIEKPQLLFETVPTNRESDPFKPLLLTKPHAVVPLETEPISADDADSQLAYGAHLILHGRLGLDLDVIRRNLRLPKDSNTGYRYPHPYQLEVEQYTYPSFVYTRAEPINYHPFEDSTATFVDTPDALDEMLAELRHAREIAIDLEHHDTRSYIGIVSLMQISTREKDWIVDTLVPWRRQLQKLNEVFADPRILKVLHGAYMDIIWLQRDLGLYIVGLFDTHFASRTLGYPGGSYAYLLKRFTGVEAQKQYQMADWRIRPLPQELLDYARSDTHYLLYIYDNMRNELVSRSNFPLPDHEGDKLWDVQERSKEESLQRYEHPVYDYETGQGAQGWYKLLSRTPAMLSKEQFAIFRRVHQWRDGVAREQDDSVHYVMANHNIISIARAIPLTRAELLSVAQPATQTVRLRADELVAVIARAREEGKDGPEMLDVLAKIEPAFAGSMARQAAKQAAATFEGVAKFIPKANTTPVTSALPLRSATSAFWGPAFESSAHKQQQQRAMSTMPQVELSVPLPPLTAEVFADPAEASTPARAAAGQFALPESPAEPVEEPGDVFILKELGKKRKRQAGTEVDGMAANSDEVAIPDEEAQRAAEKAERKKARKEAKRAAKAGLAPDLGHAHDVAEEEPFHYASAPSILNPPRPSREQMKEQRKKQINPYGKSLDAPKGLPRAQKERAGRSMTYKS